MTLPGLTRRQRDLLVFIAAHTDRHGEAPTYDEMRVGLGFSSKSPVARLVDGLVERGYLTRLRNRSRSLAITPAARGASKPSPGHYLIQLPHALDAALKTYATQHGLDPAVIVRRAVEQAFGRP